VADQLFFQQPDEQERRNRLAEALRQTRAAAGPESVLRVLEAEPDSRVPERRAFLTPFPE
jgi:protein ImuB